MFPWWILEINFVASGLLLAIGIISLVLSFNLVRRDDSYDSSCKVLALANIGLAILFFAYLHQYMAHIRHGGAMTLVRGPFSNYTFDQPSLIIYSALIVLPSLLSILVLLRSRPAISQTSRKRSYMVLAITVFLVVAASAGTGLYYNYLNQQKASMVVEELGNDQDIKLYRINDDFTQGTWMQGQDVPYFIDSKGATSGRFVSQDTYDAIRFLSETDTTGVMAWWDPALEIKAAGKTPVICYASERIEHTVSRPTSIDKFEPDERVADVARFFATDSAEEAKGISEEYDATTVYVPRYYGHGLFWAMTEAMDTESGFEYEGSMYHRFISGDEPESFEKIFENEGVRIYRLR
ncbi:MAG: hypothetical protein C4B59_13395 [Candidatus Methanogaster sp.]|uniref:Uncharacterized protein n=1 Tax=Candidatus Methanogaster sp. TaxID=3386292 RepID=A0AC61L000_9EURY|nr:MAG: hypothetical protein C4B59_13395 [ANME-2 cluster archaeon]